MFFTSENQTLYPASLEYNIALIMSELAKIAENNGAIVKYNAYNHGFIVNRSILEMIQEHENRVERLEELLKEGKTCSLFDANKELTDKARKAMTRAIQEHKNAIETLKGINNEPIEVTNTSYVIFVLEDVYYCYSMPDLIFDPANLYKTPVIDGKYNRSCYGIEDNKESWFYDCFWRYDCSKADIKEAANLIYNLMMNAPMSKPFRNSYKKRVSNTYNNGYHYETVYEPIKLTAVDFLPVDK